MHPRDRRPLLAGLLLASVGLLAACGSSTDAVDTAANVPVDIDVATVSADSRTFVGDLDGTGTRLGLIVDGSSAWGYLCDPDGVSRAVVGTVEGNAVRLAEPDGDAVVEGRLDGDTFFGTVHLGGTGHDVEAVTGSGATVLVAADGDADNSTVGAWIRDTEGTAVGQAVEVVAADDPSRPQITVVDGGTVAPPQAVEARKAGILRCFLASRRLVRAEQALDAEPNFGNAAAVELAHIAYVEACGF